MCLCSRRFREHGTSFGKIGPKVQPNIHVITSASVELQITKTRCQLVEEVSFEGVFWSVFAKYFGEDTADFPKTLRNRAAIRLPFFCVFQVSFSILAGITKIQGDLVGDQKPTENRWSPLYWISHSPTLHTSHRFFPKWKEFRAKIRHLQKTLPKYTSTTSWQRA